jgi:beta-glucosidase
MMISSGWVNNVAGHANKRLLVDFLRTELGWKNGFMLTDFEDINGLIERGVASSYTDATDKAINAGSDVSLAPRGERFINSMMELIQAKKISESRVNGVVTDVLKIKEAVGLFEKPFPFEANMYAPALLCRYL